MAPDAGTKGFPFAEIGTLHRAAVVCHRNADADSYLSAFAIARLIESLAPECEVIIGTPGGMTTLTQKLSARFKHAAAAKGDGDFDLYVAVDVGDEELLGDWKGKMASSAGVRVLVDHHPARATRLYDRAVVDEAATSAAEVAFGIYEGAGARPDAESAQALLEALLFDSSHLAIASSSGLRVAVKLIDMGADLALARKELRSEPDYGEVLAKLKGAQRLSINKAGDWVVASSRIGSFQAHVARALVYLGADLAVVGGESDGETRVSLRSTQRFLDRTGVNLGTQVAEEMAFRLGGHGGGHPTAASFSTKEEEDKTVEATMRRVGELLGDVKKLD